MNRIRALLLLSVAFAFAPAARGDKLKVVCTHSGLGDIARQVGGDRVEVTNITRPNGDVHAVQARPSVFAALADADAFVHSGLDLELWAKDAIKGSRNSGIAPGRPGNIDASLGIKLLNVPANPSRAEGDIHVYGNPHYWTDPLNAKIIANTIAAGFTALDAAGAEVYLANRKRFEADLNQRLVPWLKKAIAYKNAPIVIYHDSFPYFTRRFGFRTVAFIEPKPRIPPTQSHLLHVIDIMKQEGVKVIVREPFHDRKATDFLAEKTGAKVVTWTTLPGGVEGTDTYQDMIEHNLSAVIEALK